nr:MULTISPECIES: protein kinase [unclassified Cryobacterium]
MVVADDRLVDSIGGYRLVRLLGAGSRAEVWLGHRSAPDGAGETVAIKRFLSGTPRREIDTELEALGRVSHRHIVELVDIAMDPDDRPCLIMARLGRVSLARLLADRGSLAPGEAVTLLVPTLEAVAELHRVGVAHGDLRPGVIHFDAVGAPVLAEFGRAELIGPFPVPPEEYSLTTARLEEHDRALADCRQLVDLLRLVLGTAGVHSVDLDDVPDNATELRDALTPSLFRAANPVPMRFDVPPIAGPPARIVIARGGDAPEAEASAAPSLVLAGAHLPAWLESLAGEWAQKTRDRTLRAAQSLRTVRKPFWVAAAAMVAAIVATAVLLQPGAGSDLEPQPVVAQPTSTETANPAILGDDPLAAAEALLAARDQCFEARSVLCLDAVDQPGSAMLERDADAIRLAQMGEESAPIRVADATLELVEELGDAVLISVSVEPDAATASLLIVRSDAGWRIRELLFE